MENVKIKQIKGADPEKKKSFFGREGGEGQEAERKQRKALIHSLCRNSPFSGQWDFFTYTSTPSWRRLWEKDSWQSGIVQPGKVMVQSPYTKPLMGFFKQPEFKSSTGQYEWEHVILTFANYNSQTQKPLRTFIYIFPLPAPFVRQPSSLALPIQYQIGNILEGGLLPFFMCGWTSQESKRPNLSASVATIIMLLCKAANKCFTGSHQGAHFSAALAG